MKNPIRRVHSVKLFSFARLCIFAAIFIAGPIHAESGLKLPYPSEFGAIAAETFNEGHQRVGDANLTIEKLDNGYIRIIADTAMDGGPRTVASAVLAPIKGGTLLQPISQESRSFDNDGNPLGVLLIDHQAGEASCARPSEDSQAMVHERIALPANDRVINVPLNLLFEPLAKGDVETVDFQILLCRSSARLMNFKASVVSRSKGGDDLHPLVEVRYVPDQGPLISFLTQALIPKLSFWFDPASQQNWLGHRMPLYSDGPEVYVVRQGITNTSILR